MAEPTTTQTRAVTYCVVPQSLGLDAFGIVRSALAGRHGLEVIAERRADERRAEADRRGRGEPVPADERRQVGNVEGRRVGERRVELVPVEAPELPAEIRSLALQLRFVRGVEPRGLQAEDSDTDRLVIRFQQGDTLALAAIYMRYFDRLYAYLMVVLRDEHAAEDATQEVFSRVVTALPRYQRRSSPFRAWLFRIARNHALDVMRAGGRTELVGDATERLEREASTERNEPDTMGWLSDRELAMFVERLPLAQRQVVMLRFMMDLPTEEIGKIMGRSAEDIRALQSRALRYLRERLAAVRAQQGQRLPVHRLGRAAGAI